LTKGMYDDILVRKRTNTERNSNHFYKINIYFQITIVLLAYKLNLSN